MIIIEISLIFLLPTLIEGHRAPKNVPIKFGPVLKSKAPIQKIDDGLAKELEEYCKPAAKRSLKMIVRGEKVASENVTDFLWAVAVFNQYFTAQMCTGTLISPIHVLTAGHCLVQSFFGDKPNQWTIGDYHVVAGAKCVQDTEECKKFGAKPIKSKVKNVAITAEMMLTNTQRHGGDIVVLELETPIKRGEHVEYACLPGEDMDLPLNAPDFIHWGWGRLDAKNPILPGVLNYLTDVSLFDCKQSNEADLDVLCTRAKRKNQGTERGDSGSGLEYIEPISKKHYVVGVLDYSLQDEKRNPIRPWETYCADLRIYAKWICELTGICYQMSHPS